MADASTTVLQSVREQDAHHLVRPPVNLSDAERWMSMAAGAGLLWLGCGRSRTVQLLTTLAGGALLGRGLLGSCPLYRALGIHTSEHGPAVAVPAGYGVKVEQSVAVDAPPEGLYRFWRRLENLPRVMGHLVSVESLDQRRSRWAAEAPLLGSVTWEAELINDRAAEVIAWRSLPGGDVETAGSVFFRAAPGGGTTVTVSLKYNPPGGKFGARLADALGQGLAQQLRDDLLSFKRSVEAGTLPDRAP